MSESAPISRKGLALALLAAAQFIVVLDASIVNVALPSMGRDLDFATEDLSWVVNAYTLVFGGFLLLGGRMADLLGRRRVFVAGIALFTFASMLGGLAQSPAWLLGARALQGVGAAIAAPSKRAPSSRTMVAIPARPSRPGTATPYTLAAATPGQRASCSCTSVVDTFSPL